MDRRRSALTAPARSDRVLLAAVPLAFLLVFFAYPVVTILAMGFDAGSVSTVLRDPGLRGVAWFTTWQAVASTALTLVLALPGAYVLSRYRFPGRTFVRAAVTVPFVLPTVVVGSAFLALGGPGGPLAGLVRLHHTVWAILLAHAFFNYAVVVRTVGGLWSHLDPRLEEAARLLGAGRWRAFGEVTLPRLAPAIAAASSIVLLFSFTSFGAVLVLGGPRLPTLEVEIYRQTAHLLDLRTAAALALVQLAVVFTLLVAYSRYQQRRAVEQRLRPFAEIARRPRGTREWGVVAVSLGPAAVFLGAPLAMLVHRSLATPDGYGLTFYRALSESRRGSTLFVPPLEAVRNSLGVAAVATAIAVVVGACAAAVVARGGGRPGRAFDALLMLPLGTSAVTVGFGFLVALDEPPLALRASPWLIPIAHALVAVPFVVRTMLPVMRSIDHRLREAAAVLGASPRRVWREVDVPIVLRAGLVAAGFAFAVSLGEFGATIFIARPDFPTMPVAIFRLLDKPGALNFGQAMAMSTILMAVTAASLILVERGRAGELREF